MVGERDSCLHIVAPLCRGAPFMARIILVEQSFTFNKEDGNAAFQTE